MLGYVYERSDNLLPENTIFSFAIGLLIIKYRKINNFDESNSSQIKIFNIYISTYMAYNILCSVLNN